MTLLAEWQILSVATEATRANLAGLATSDVAPLQAFVLKLMAYIWMPHR